MLKKSAIHQTKKEHREYYALSNKALILLSKKGNVKARQALKERKAVHRMVTEEGFSEADLSCKLSNGLRLHFHREGFGWVRMFIEMRDRTALDHIKQGWNEICTWRYLLQEWQGPWTYDGDDNLFRRLHDRHAEGESYAALAQSLNRRVEKDLGEYVNDHRIWNKVKSTLKTERDIMWWGLVGPDLGFEGGYGLSNAKRLLRYMGLKEEKIGDFCQEAIESLERGEAPFWTAGQRPYEEPITRDHVIARLKIWRQKNEKWLKVREKAHEKWLKARQEAKSETPVDMYSKMQGKSQEKKDRYFERRRKAQEKMTENAMTWQEWFQKREKVEKLIKGD